MPSKPKSKKKSGPSMRGRFLCFYSFKKKLSAGGGVSEAVEASVSRMSFSRERERFNRPVRGVRISVNI